MCQHKQIADLSQISCCYESVALAIENSKSLANFLLDIRVFELPDLSSTKGQTYYLAPFEVMVWFENFAIVGLFI